MVQPQAEALLILILGPSTISNQALLKLSLFSFDSF